MSNKMDHITPDLSPKYDEAKAKNAAKEVEKLREKEADLVEELADVRSQISLKIAESKLAYAKPGFSNAPSAKEQAAANKTTQEDNAKTSKATK
jgi:phage terminase large subunit